MKNLSLLSNNTNGWYMLSMIMITLVLFSVDGLVCLGFTSHSTPFAPPIRSLPVGFTGVIRNNALPVIDYSLCSKASIVRKAYHRSSALFAGISEDTNSVINSTSTGDTAVDKDEKLFEGYGKGILRDYKMRLPFYKGDIKDGLNIQCLAATMALFFACLAPAIGFGALFGVATGNAIGSVEMITSTAACGIIYALGSAQPMTIIGSTGPVLAFVATLYRLASKIGVPFLPFYAWTGIWTSFILFISSVTSGSNLVKYLTKFTDDIFSVLISCIFVVEAVSDIAGTFTSPLSTFTKGLLSLVCATTTFGLASSLKKLRQSVYLEKSIRNTISNFAPTIGVVTATLIARWARITQGPSAGIPCLSMLQTFGTSSGRPWLIPLFDLPVWARWFAFVPALMATVLLFLDQNITVRLVNNPRFRMTKGRRERNQTDGMHADMLVISILTFLQSLVGLPWLIAATVRSLAHVGACQKFDDKGQPNGTIEQRVTGTAIHTMIASVILFRKPREILSNLPLSVLMGLFMYLGTSSLPGNEMWERITGLIKDKSISPKEPWTNKVPTKIINLYTFIQVTCLGAMFWVKSSPIGVLFPVVIAMLAPLRFGLERSGIIKKEYIEILDSDD